MFRYDDESVFSKTCNIIPMTNAAPILLRLRQEEFVVVGGREKLRRLATDKELRESPRLLLPTLILDQIFVDKPPPNRVLPFASDAAPDGVLASRVLFYQWFPCDFQLLVVSVLKSVKAHQAYDSAMRDTQNPKFVAVSAIVRLFRLEHSLKKGRPTLVELLSDKISIKWPNQAMQERSRAAFAHAVCSSAASMKLKRFGSDGTPTPLSPGPPTPSSVASTTAITSYVYFFFLLWSGLRFHLCAHLFSFRTWFCRFVAGSCACGIPPCVRVFSTARHTSFACFQLVFVFDCFFRSISKCKGSLTTRHRRIH